MIVVGFCGAAGITLVAYAADYAVFRYRLGTNAAFGQMTVSSYDAVQQKNGKTVNQSSFTRSWPNSIGLVVQSICVSIAISEPGPVSCGA